MRKGESLDRLHASVIGGLRKQLPVMEGTGFHQTDSASALILHFQSSEKLEMQCILFIHYPVWFILLE